MAINPLKTQPAFPTKKALLEHLRSASGKQKLKWWKLSLLFLSTTSVLFFKSCRDIYIAGGIPFGYETWTPPTTTIEDLITTSTTIGQVTTIQPDQIVTTTTTIRHHHHDDGDRD